MRVEQKVAKFLLSDFNGMVKKRKLTIATSGISPEFIGSLMRLEMEGKLDRKSTREIITVILDR